MPTKVPLQDFLVIGSGAAVGAIFASTGRVVPHPMTSRPWPYTIVLLSGLGLIAFEQTRLFGIGMAAYGLGKVFLKSILQ